MPKAFWKVAPGEKAYLWDFCRERQCITIGWLNQTNLRGMSKAEILEVLEDADEGKSRSANTIWQFV